MFLDVMVVNYLIAVILSPSIPFLSFIQYSGKGETPSILAPDGNAWSKSDAASLVTVAPKPLPKVTFSLHLY